MPPLAFQMSVLERLDKVKQICVFDFNTLKKWVCILFDKLKNGRKCIRYEWWKKKKKPFAEKDKNLFEAAPLNTKKHKFEQTSIFLAIFLYLKIKHLYKITFWKVVAFFYTVLMLSKYMVLHFTLPLYTF